MQQDGYARATGKVGLHGHIWPSATNRNGNCNSLHGFYSDYCNYVTLLFHFWEEILP